jgi:SsrA-binding protein
MATPKHIEIKNKKATYEYFIIQTYEAGIMLQGTEIKSIRQGFANLNDAYCILQKGNVIVKSLFIKPYSEAAHFNHEARRDRLLLLNKTEIRKIERQVTEKGMTIIPTRLYLNERGYIKLEIAVAKGKKIYDKRHSIKEKDNKKEMDRINKIR